MSYAPVGPGDVPDSDHNDSFRRLYEMHGSVILNYLIRFTGGDRHRAEDILQETLLRAWRHPEARLASGEWSLPWLFTVARRIALDQLRSALVRPHELNDERIHERPELDDRFERLVDEEEVRAALASLPDRLRDVLMEIYFRDHSVAEASAILGVPKGTVKSRTYYGLRALREKLIERGFIKAEDE
jgi:RNA polymerase sigma-70 factor, ECF subfamily